MTQNRRTTEKTNEKKVEKSAEASAGKTAEKSGEKAGQKKAASAVGSFTVTLGFSSLMTVLTALVGAVVVAFMMGVIVGRDDVASRPTLAQVAEAQEAAMQAQKAKEETGQDATASAKQTEQVAPPPAQVMTPEELKYATALKSKGEQKASPPPSVEKKEPAPPAQSSDASAPKENAAPVQNVQQPQNNENALFDYVYQVASLKDEAAVDKLRAQLEGEGFRTRTGKSGDYMMVLILMRGTSAQALALQDRMVQLKLGKPVQQQKVAVE